MTDLVACLSTGSWGHVNRLIADGGFEKVFLITNEFGKEKFQKKDNVELIVVNDGKPVDELIENIVNGLKDKVSGIEVGLNLVSGTGKEHMAIISALMKVGVGFRLVALTKNGIKEI